jgi:hypothetical protein
MQEIIDGIVNDQALGALVVTACLLTAADLASGIFAAIREDTFDPTWVARFIRTHVMGRVVPITLVAFIGHFEPALFAIAGLAAGAYAIETLASIRHNLMVPPDEGDKFP